jgi:hypothetical protein
MLFRGSWVILVFEQLQEKREEVKLKFSTLLTLKRPVILFGAAGLKVRFWNVLGFEILGGLARQLVRALEAVKPHYLVEAIYSHLGRAEV